MPASPPRDGRESTVCLHELDRSGAALVEAGHPIEPRLELSAVLTLWFSTMRARLVPLV